MYNRLAKFFTSNFNVLSIFMFLALSVFGPYSVWLAANGHIIIAYLLVLFSVFISLGLWFWWTLTVKVLKDPLGAMTKALSTIQNLDLSGFFKDDER